MQRLLANSISVFAIVGAALFFSDTAALGESPDQPAEAPALVDPGQSQPETTEPGISEPETTQPVDIDRPLESERLLEIDREPSLDTRISYAGGAVTFTVPQDWNVGELPSGRSIRLLLSPVEIPQSLSELRDGVWMNYRYRLAKSGSAQAELLQLLTQSTKSSKQGHRADKPPVVLTIDSKPAMLQELITQDKQGELQELRLLARTQQGLLTIHLVAPEVDFDRRKQALLDMLQGMKLTSPDLSVAKTPAELIQAAPIVGSWKALQSRLVLTPDGQVVTIFDQKNNYAIDSRGYLDFKNKVQRLTGKFVAKNDLILITWDDGSRLNYRWRVSGGQLFLTDHHGRVSQLERLFQ